MVLPTAGERLIVALDVPGPDEASALVAELEGVVSFYKVGPELLLTGGMADIIEDLVRDCRVFVDLKLGDISETVRRVVSKAANLGVRFLTLGPYSDEATVKAAILGKAGAEFPKVLCVSSLSSFDQADFARIYGTRETAFEPYLLDRAKRMLDAGCDGFIASGEAIKLIRDQHPATLIVSPGVRPAGASTDDHKRFTTPAEAIRMGADYLVVGRPILKAPSRLEAARAIIDEMDGALPGGPGRSRMATSAAPASPRLRPNPAV